jgi:hypothetical protein
MRPATTLAFLAVCSMNIGAVLAEPLRGCFVRAYDKAHLAQHPDQMIARVKLRIYANPTDPTKSSFSIWMQRRRKDRALHNEGVCESWDGVTTCYIECDGGGVRVFPQAKSTVLVRLGVQPPHGPSGEPIKQDERIRMAPCGAQDADDESLVEITGKKDDHEFLLYRADAVACAGIDR